MKKPTRVITGFATLLALAAIALLSTCAEPPASPELVSLIFRAADNPALPVDVEGVIDEGTDLVTVRLPDTVPVAAYADLKAQAIFSEGNSAAPSLPSDFSMNPTPITVANALGEQRTYLVDLSPEVKDYGPDALIFTEYYAGTGYALKNDFNRWIEITNIASETVDLSAFHLRKAARQDGLRVPELDQSIRLSGNLPAGASLLIYADRTNSSTFSQVRSLVAPDLTRSDALLNGILDFDGDDGYQLLRDGVVLDVIGPNGGTGGESYWGREKRMLRKNGRLPSPVWDEKAWVAYVITNTASDDDNAGNLTPAFGTTDTTLTYFALENFTPRVYGTINQTDKTVVLSVEEGTDLSAVRPYFSTQGAGVTYQSKLIYSGETTVNLNSPQVFTIWASDPSFSQNYTVSVSYYHVMQYVPTNYTFSGGVKAAYDAAIAAGGTSTPYTTPAEGVVTAKNVYMTSTYKNCFFIQDRDKGILVLSATAIAPPVGSRVRVVPTSVVTYYSMPEIQGFTSVSQVDTTVYDIYYKTGAYNSLDSLGDVYMWDGIIAEGMDNYYVGTFEGALQYHGTSAFKTTLAEGKRGTFYGPITFSYDVYRMEINDPFQIKLR